MAKAEWGIKRVCQSCNVVYYDMKKDPPTCPKCGTKFDPEALLKSRRGRAIPVDEPKVTKAKPEAEAAEEVEATEEAEDNSEAVVPEDESVESLEDLDEGDDDEDEEDDTIEDASELGEDEDDVAIEVEAEEGER